MKRHFVWILATLVLIEFLSLDLIGFAEDGKWVRNTNMPTARWGLSTCVVNGKIYAIGGCGPEAPVNAVEEYDPATDTWRWKDSMPSGIYALSTSVV
ncbi:MAG: kelch repeat-containing protein, partial [Candidatus Poribacteria bacterium]